MGRRAGDGAERKRELRLIERFQRGDSFGLVLAALILLFLMAPTIGASRPGQVVTFGLISGILLLALHTSKIKPKLFRIAMIVAIVNFVAAVLVTFGKIDNGAAANTGLGALLVLVTCVTILRRIMNHPVVATETILGAICVYVLIGLFFAIVYQFIGKISSVPVLTGLDLEKPMQAFYFSFVTLTTTGYGDVTASTNMARTIAILEALTGQLFLATTIARLVATLRVPRPFAEIDSEEGAPPGTNEVANPGT